MPTPENTLKKRLLAGEVLHGCWFGMADPYACEMAMTAGFDWLLLDGEHAPNDLPRLSAQVAMFRPGDATQPVLRLVDSGTEKIKQALDIGAQTLLIPMVESVEEAARIVRATRYGPAGNRGVGASLARASRFSAIPDYIATANDQVCLILQIESRAGLAALPGILAVDGVDGVFIGPSDLAADMGFPGQPKAPEVYAAVMEALRRIRAAGRIAGVLSTEDAFIADARAAGANFIGVGIDVLLYVKAMRDLAAKYRG